MEEGYKFILDLALILISTKLLGLLSKWIHMPQVVGALLAGLILGPAVLGVVEQTSFLTAVSELGVIVLMFSAGLESDLRELKRTGKASFIIALLGVIVPLLGGFGLAALFHGTGWLTTETGVNELLQNIFVGVILTATSVSITVETLREMGKLNSRVGNAILGAAIIDDILGIICLTIITSLADTSVNVGIVLLKVLGFFVFSIGVGVLFYLFFKKWTAHYEKDLRRFVIVAFTFCLLMAYCAEVLFGVADITGAFIAGLIISNTQHARYIARRFDTVSYALLSPVFFASIGLGVVLDNMSLMIGLFALALVIVAIITKIIGCGLGARICGFNKRESTQIGMGMVSRGEVALIVAQKGGGVGLLSSSLLAPVIIVVVATTILSPIFLKLSFKEKGKKTKGISESAEEQAQSQPALEKETPAK